MTDRTGKVTATASVTATVTIELSQPWGPTSTLTDVQRVASREAINRIQTFNEVLTKHGAQIGSITSIRIVLNEEKEP